LLDVALILLLTAAVEEELCEGIEEEEGRGDGVDNALIGSVERLPDVV
jgi:hypothetical protein